MKKLIIENDLFAEIEKFEKKKTYKVWTKKEEDFLRKVYNEYSCADIARVLKTTEDRVIHKKRKMVSEGIWK